jgi:hypothetical protein
MSIWSQVSSLLWEEAAVDSREPAPRTGPEAAGIPNYARKAVRFATIGFTALVLVSQVTGVRLAASVDADPTYCVLASQQCKAACPGPGESQSQCVQRCNDQRKDCERAP